jgi:hypothetical protein
MSCFITKLELTSISAAALKARKESKRRDDSFQATMMDATQDQLISRGESIGKETERQRGRRVG